MGHSIRQDRAYLGISLYLGNLILLVIVSGLVKQLTEFYTVSQALFFRYLVVALPMAGIWIPILGVIDWTLFVGIGLIAFVQQYLLVSAFRYGEASMIAPFEYTGLIFSAAIGYLFWAEIPTLSTWVGSIIIIASGLVIMTRDKKAKTPGLL